MLAGMVREPDRLQPGHQPGRGAQSAQCGDQRMRQQHYITLAQAQAAQAAPLGLHMHDSALQSGCTSQSARRGRVLLRLRARRHEAQPGVREGIRGAEHDRRPEDLHHAEPEGPGAPPRARWTTSSPAHSPTLQSRPQRGRRGADPAGHRQGPGDRGGPAVRQRAWTDHGGLRGGYRSTTAGGRADRLVIEALHPGDGAEAGHSFRLQPEDPSPASRTGYTSCKGGVTGPFNVSNAEGTGQGHLHAVQRHHAAPSTCSTRRWSSQVGLCNVVKTAASLGVTRADGTSLLRRDPHLPRDNNLSADNYPSFTLGSMYVSPMSMAAAYATVAARGMYCAPIAITKIDTSAGTPLPVESAGCHRVLTTQVADAANYILQGVITSGHRGWPGHRSPGRGQDRHRQRRLLRRVRRLHPAPGRLCVGLQSEPSDYDRGDALRAALVLPRGAAERDVPRADVR